MTDEQQMVLKMVQDGKITVEDAERLLKAMNQPTLAGSPEEQTRPPVPPRRPFSELTQVWGAVGGERGRDVDATHDTSSGSFLADEEIIWPAREGDLDEPFETHAPLPLAGRIRLQDVHGGVSITGADVPDVEVRVLKRVRALDPDLARQLLQDFQIHVTVDGDDLVVRSSRPRPQDQGLQDRVRGMWAFYTLVVPRRAGAAVSFQHGKVRVVKLDGSVDLEGAHGEWAGRDLSGPVRLRHEHGAVQLADLESGLQARKAHGAFQLARLHGDLELKAEHGTVQLVGVDGGSDLVGGHGNWEARDLTGAVRLKHEHGHVHLSNLDAGLDVHKSHGRLEISGLQGELRMESQHGDRRLHDIGGRAEVKHGHGPIELRRLGAGLQLEARHSHVSIDFASALAGDVALDLGHCQAELRLPTGSSARLDVATDHGHLDAPGLSIVEKGRHSVRARGTLGSGEHHVSVEGHHTNIHVKTDDPETR